MSFTSFPFYTLLTATLLGYWSVRGHRMRLWFLLAASFIFYGAWSLKYSLLLVFSTVLDYGVGLGLGRIADPRRRKGLLWLSLTGNLGMLFFFKYYNFFAGAFVDFTHLIGLPISLPVAQVLLPIGISFYTFQTLSYTIDVYRGRFKPCRDPLQFFVYVTFFPQLVAGPIERASHLLPQLNDLAAKSLNRATILIAVNRILFGLFKKLVIADSLAPQVDLLFTEYERYGAMGVALGALGFALQIYCDFSAYSDIAVGVARLFGVRLSENFRAPYLATSPADLWSRWHMTLFAWLRDYLYAPLVRSRFFKGRRELVVLLVMVLSGLWHGANFTFLTWGIYSGMGLTLHRQLAQRELYPPLMPYLRALLGWILTILGLWVLSALMFRSQDMRQMLGMYRVLFTLSPAELTVAHAHLYWLWAGLVALEHCGVEAFHRSIGFRNWLTAPASQWAAFGFLMPVVLAFFFRDPRVWNTSFIYFAF